MTTSQFVVHGFAICITVWVTFTFALFLLPGVTSLLRSRSPSVAGYLGLGFCYFALPLLFTITGVGLLGAADPAMRAAIPLPPSAREGIDWTYKLGSGAVAFAVMSLCTARFFTALFHRDFSKTVFFVGLGVLMVFTVITYMERQYTELLVENTLRMAFLPRYAIMVGVAGILTEALVRASGRHLSERLEPGSTA